jgi:hypothetical protein
MKPDPTATISNAISEIVLSYDRGLAGYLALQLGYPKDEILKHIYEYNYSRYGIEEE